MTDRTTPQEAAQPLNQWGKPVIACPNPEACNYHGCEAHCRPASGCVTSMTTPQEASRAAFEAWYSDGGEWPPAVERNTSGHYKLLSTCEAWVAWQAATAARDADTARLDWLAQNKAWGVLWQQDTPDDLRAAIDASREPQQ